MEKGKYEINRSEFVAEFIKTFKASKEGYADWYIGKMLAIVILALEESDYFELKEP